MNQESRLEKFNLNRSNGGFNYEVGKPRQGFTVLELLITMGAIVAIIVAALLFLDPDQFLKEKRDELRMKELNDIKNSLDIYIESATGTISLGPANIVFSSNVGVVRNKNNEIVSLKFDTKNPRATNSMGWLPVNFDSLYANQSPNAKVGDGFSLNALPRDPRNVDSYVYTFTTDGEGKYKLTTTFESNKYLSKMRDDCGQNQNRYEVGTNCDLNP